ncbi:MAG: 3-isopropylmalate dehydratase large subunit [Armatimonadota bacterium]
MTIVEKILAAKSGNDAVRPGEFVTAQLDLVLMNDVTAPLAIETFREVGATEVFHRDKIALVADHFTPSRDIRAAMECKRMREFAHEQRITHHYEGGRCGIEHILLPDEGLVLPGDAVIGADSHTCTYGALGAFATGVGSTEAAAAMVLGECWFRVPESLRFTYTGELGEWIGGKDLILHTIGQIGVDGARYRAMEFTGPVIDGLGMAGRFTMCNMAIEAGGKCGLVAPDATTEAFVQPRARRAYETYESDADAEYAETYEWDCTGLEPQVAVPHLPENARPVSEVNGTRIDQAVIGACTNGRIEDLRVAARVMGDNQVAPGVRMIVIPGTQDIYVQALREGLIETFAAAGAVIGAPTCGPCLGGHTGVLAAGERAISTTNRNFVGRMGHTESEVYLSGPAVAAASAVAGEIVGPEGVASTT